MICITSVLYYTNKFVQCLYLNVSVINSSEKGRVSLLHFKALHALNKVKLNELKPVGMLICRNVSKSVSFILGIFCYKNVIVVFPIFHFND